MKVAVINYSGSVGKTLVSTYLLAPRLKDAKFFAVETINQSASDLGIENVTSFKGDDFSRLIEDVVFEDAAIIDIGASNVEAFLMAMSRFDSGAGAATAEGRTGIQYEGTAGHLGKTDGAESGGHGG